MRSRESLDANDLVHSGIIEFRPSIERLAMYVIAVVPAVPDAPQHLVNRRGRDGAGHANNSALMEILELLTGKHYTRQFD